MTELALVRQHRELGAILAAKATKIPHKFKVSFKTAVRWYVSVYVMNFVHKKKIKVENTHTILFQDWYFRLFNKFATKNMYVRMTSLSY